MREANTSDQGEEKVVDTIQSAVLRLVFCFVSVAALTIHVSRNTLFIHYQRQPKHRLPFECSGNRLVILLLACSCILVAAPPLTSSPPTRLSSQDRQSRPFCDIRRGKGKGVMEVVLGRTVGRFNTRKVWWVGSVRLNRRLASGKGLYSRCQRHCLRLSFSGVSATKRRAWCQKLLEAGRWQWADLALRYSWSSRSPVARHMRSIVAVDRLERQASI